MFCYVNEIAWGKALSNIPTALREKFVNGVEELGANLGIDCIASETGWLQIRMLPSATIQGLFRWMEDAQIVAVEVEAADIVPLLGRTFDALLVKRGIDNGAVNLGRLEPHELMEALHNAAWSLQSTSDNPDETSGVYLDAAKFDLVRSGLMSQAEVDSTADPFAGESQASGHYDGGGDHGELPIELTEAVPDQFDPFN